MDKIFNKPFAINGARVTIPENGTENERVSFDKGFTQPYEVEAPSIDNPNGQGFNILRPEMNEILNQLSNACNFLAENIDKWTALTTENLNDIKQAGRYYQKYNAYATEANNYPANLAGYLIVLNNGIGLYGVTQIYKIWNSERIYIRRTTSTTDWSNWDSLVLTSEYNTQITQLQNTDTNLNNNKEDKTKFTNGIINNTTNSNLDNLTQNGFYWRKSNQGSPLPTNNGGAVIVNTDGAQVIQYFYTDIWISSSASGAWFRTKNAGGTWTDWHHLENSEHAEDTYRKIADSYTKTETNNLLNQKENKTKISTQDLTTENLNNIAEQGYFRQGYNTNATAERNYPVQQAGTLINLIPSGSSDTYLTQIYIAKDGYGIFTRSRKSNLSWTDWERLALKSEVDLKRNISDSYSKTETNNTFLTKTDANSTYRKIADSYTKSEVYTKTETNNLMVAGGYSRTGYNANNIANATIPIPNKSIITGCCIMVTGIYNTGANSPIDTNFIFKIDGTEIGRINLYKNGQTGEGIGTFHLINQGSFNLSGKLGKTIIPSIVQNSGSITKFNFLVVWQ